MTRRLLAAFVQGKLSAARQAEVRRFLGRSPEARSFVRQLGRQVARRKAAQPPARKKRRFLLAAGVGVALLGLLAGVAISFANPAEKGREAAPAPAAPPAEEVSRPAKVESPQVAEPPALPVEAHPTAAVEELPVAPAVIPPEPVKVAVPETKPEPKPQEPEASAPAPPAPPVELPADLGAKLDAPTLARAIDALIQKRLDAAGVKPSPLADDAEFLRRVYLDIAGVIPAPEKVAQFLDSKDPQKRAKLIDELLADPAHVRHMTDIWKGLLIPNTAASARRQHGPMVHWLEDSFSKNKPWDRFASEIITAAGLQDENGAVTFYLTHESVNEVTDRVARVFLGVQIQCAQCHDHRFASWTKDEYWGLAAFFTGIREEFVRDGAIQRAGISDNGKGRALMLPPSLKKLPPTFLRGEKPAVTAATPLRPLLAGWMTSPKNPYFAKAMANRLWQQLMGRGLVNPVDDMHEDNRPSHPEVLQLLERQFVLNGFDVRYLLRAIAASQTYQRTSRPANGNADDAALYSHAAIKIMTPFQLHDSLQQVVSPAEARRIEFSPDPKKGLTREEMQQFRARTTSRTLFASFFEGEEGAEPTAYQTGIPQALRLMNSQQTSSTTRTINELVKTNSTPAQMIGHMFLATLSRRPSAAELHSFTGYVAKQPDKNRAYGDILWALLNSTEFYANH